MNKKEYQFLKRYEELKRRNIGKYHIAIEESLTRVYQHSSGKGFFIISAFTENRSEDENMERQRQLRNDLKKAGLGFFEIYGKWYNEKKQKFVPELVLFVPYTSKYIPEEFWDEAFKLMKKYDQEAIIYQKPGGKTIYVLDNKKNKVFEIGSFQADKIGESYATLKYGKHTGSSFMFEGIRRPGGWAHAMSMKEQGYIL